MHCPFEEGGGLKTKAAAILYVFGVLLLLSGLEGLSSPAQARTTFVSIGTGGITGVYYPAGNAIAKLINRKRRVYGIRATVESTSGSVFNINAILTGDLEFGIVQSDRQYQAWHGLAEWGTSGPQSSLRAVFSIHPEAVTLVAAEDADVKGIQDLKGKRVNIGNPGSGQRQNAIDALQAAGMDYRADIEAESVKAAEAPGLLQDRRIDAFFYTVGHPSGAIKEASAGTRKVRIIPIHDIEALLAKHPFYAAATIPKAFYPRAVNREDIATFGVKATLMTSAAVADEIVYAITKEVFENLDDFKKLHPAFQVLKRQEMLQGLSVPLHPGAIRYYREAGLLE